MYNIFRAINSDQSGKSSTGAKRTVSGVKNVGEDTGDGEKAKPRRNEKYFKSVRTIYVIQGKRKSCYQRFCQNANWNVFLAFWNFIRSIPHRLRVAYLGTFLIPQYRPEWGMYVRWNPKYPPRSSEELEKRRVRRRRKTLSQQEKSEVKWKQAKAEAQKRAVFMEEPPKPVAHDHSECLQVKINVAGMIFEPQVRSLKQFPNTLLGNPRKLMRYYDPEHDEYFFDRHRTSFEAILSFYQTGGIIRKPPIMGFEHFLEEVKFYELGSDIIKYLEESEGVGLEEEKPLTKGLFRRKLWLLFEYPESSYQSRIVAYLSVLAVCLTIFEFCIETMAEFQWKDGDRGKDSNPFDIQDPLFLTETICVVFFVFEYVMRILTSPNLFIFVKDFSNLIDLIAIIPYFVNLAYIGSSDEEQAMNVPTKKGSASLTILRIIRLVRVFRILKLSRHNRGLKILGKTLKASGRELGLLVFFLVIGVVIFSSAIFFAEISSTDSPFESIPAGFWFSVVTMTTLGYGDMVPITALGKVVGALCAIAGVLTISLPVPVIVSNFNMFYNREELNEIDESNQEGNFIEQCPFFPGWYNAEGELIDNQNTAREDDEHPHSKWLRGVRLPEHSDTDFEDLKKDEMLKHTKSHNNAPVKKKKKQSRARRSRRLSSFTVQSKRVKVQGE